MSTFSERYGYVVKPLQLESMTIELRNRIWNIYRCEICNDIAVIDSHYLEEIMDACGLSYTSVYDNADLDKNLAVFENGMIRQNGIESMISLKYISHFSRRKTSVMQ